MRPRTKPTHPPITLHFCVFQRSSVVDVLMLNEAQMVRKTSGGKQGTQFEIITKKQRTLLFVGHLYYHLDKTINDTYSSTLTRQGA